MDGLREQAEREERGEGKNEMFKNFVWSVVKLTILTAKGQWSAFLSKNMYFNLSLTNAWNMETMGSAGKSVCLLMESAKKYRAAIGFDFASDWLWRQYRYSDWSKWTNLSTKRLNSLRKVFQLLLGDFSNIKIILQFYLLSRKTKIKWDLNSWKV